MSLMAKDQKGMTAIMFAMVFSVILTMIAVGFAFLVRNDQRQTLDRYLAYQAQYAAESGVNQAISEIRSAPAPTEQGDCKAYEFSDGVKATCVTWTSEADYIFKESLGTEPFITKIKPSASYSSLKITWQKEGAGAGSVYPGGTSLPDIDSNKFPVLRLSIMGKNGTAYVNFKQVYIVPTTAPPGSATFNAIDDGDVVSAICAADQCEMTLNGADNSGNRYDPEAVVAIAALGSQADWVKIEASQGGVSRKLLGAQITIDSNAIAEDITKRVEARIPYDPSETWNPGFAAAAGSMCKDIRIDGSNNNSVSGGPVCPIVGP